MDSFDSSDDLQTASEAAHLAMYKFNKKLVFGTQLPLFEKLVSDLLVCSLVISVTVRSTVRMCKQLMVSQTKLLNVDTF
jgi:hypothetical protein